MFLKSQGMTLVEVIMACFVVATLMGMIALLLNRTIFVNRYAIEQGLNTYSIDSSLKNFARFLREARQSDRGDYLLLSAQPFEIVFFSNIDNDSAIERVRLFLSNQQLKMGVAESFGFPATYPENDQEVKIIGNGIVNTEEQPLFYYYNRDYPADQINNPLQGVISPQTVSLIKIDVYANIQPGHTPENMRMQTFVRPRNIDYN